MMQCAHNVMLPHEQLQDTLHRAKQSKVTTLMVVMSPCWRVRRHLSVNLYWSDVAMMGVALLYCRNLQKLEIEGDGFAVNSRGSCISMGGHR